MREREEEGREREGKKGGTGREKRWGNRGMIKGGEEYGEEPGMNGELGGEVKEGKGREKRKVEEEKREEKEREGGRKKTIIGSHGRQTMRNSHRPHLCIGTPR